MFSNVFSQPVALPGTCHDERRSDSLRTISIGTDIIECVRIARMIENHGELFLQRVFTRVKSSIVHLADRHAALRGSLGR